MSKPGPILVASDLSPGGARAADLAMRASRALGRPIRLVHATDLPAPGAGVPPAMQSVEKLLRARVEARIAHLRELLEQERARIQAQGVSVEAALIDGRPWQAIVSEAERAAASLLVVGPHGQSGPAEILRATALEWLLGITADRVVRYAPCPVLVAPNRGDIGALGGRWVVALDHEDPSRHALRVALELAPACGARVHALHVVPDIPMLPAPGQGLVEAMPEPYDPQLEERIALEQLDQLVAEVRAGFAQAPEVTTQILRGDAAAAVSDAAKEGASLLAIGTHGRKGVAHALLGSVAERVLRRASVPVLCVRA